MKEIWTLIVKTSLPNTAEDVTELDTKVYTFESFENAKNVLRDKLKEYAFNKNSMFDGDGYISKLNEYQNDLEDEEEEEVDKYLLTSSKINKIQQAFLKVFQGEDTSLKLQRVKSCSDWMIGLDWDGETLKIYGDEEGPCNGYAPHIKTNMFDMNKEKNYCFYIDDMFGQDDNSSELYIDLIKTTLE